MFRQIVAHRWSAGLGDEAKEAFRTALMSLRGIPELVDLQAGDDARLFAGNFDYVAVLDFADFTAAQCARTASSSSSRPPGHYRTGTRSGGRRRNCSNRIGSNSRPASAPSSWFAASATRAYARSTPRASSGSALASFRHTTATDPAAIISNLDRT